MSERLKIVPPGVFEVCPDCSHFKSLAKVIESLSSASETQEVQVSCKPANLLIDFFQKKSGAGERIISAQEPIKINKLITGCHGYANKTQP